MIKRIIQEKIEISLTKYPVVGIIGSRQVGKTTLAKMIMQTDSYPIGKNVFTLPAKDLEKVFD